MLTFEIHDNDRGWLPAATIAFLSANSTRIEYDLDYVSEFLGRRDHRALSLALPVDPLPIKGPVPGFILDLLPQGEPLKRILGRYNIGRSDDYEDILRKVPLASPGNIRVKEAWQTVEQLRPTYRHPGFTREEILAQRNDFVEYMEKHGAPIGGTSGAGGGSPKFLLREDQRGRFHADGMLDDAQTNRAFLIKFPFTDSKNSADMARVEKAYYDIIRTLPVISGAALELFDTTLFIERFDRVRGKNRTLQYHGLESMYSAQNINIPSARLRHEDNITAIRTYSTDVKVDVLEYIKRDILNQLIANTDNHGRNTSFIKDERGIRLSPLYDLTAMQFFTGDYIVELTRWDEKNREFGARMNWLVDEGALDQKFLKAGLRQFYQRVSNIEEQIVAGGVPMDFVERSRETRRLTLDELNKFVASDRGA